MTGIRGLSEGVLRTACELTVNSEEKIKAYIIIGKNLKVRKQWASPVAKVVKKKNVFNAGDMSLIPGQEDPLEEEMATHSRILAWKIPWTEEPG